MHILSCSYLSVALSAMLARHESFTAVLLNVLLRMSALHLGATLILAVHRLVAAIT